jgi:hypothetical protein
MDVFEILNRVLTRKDGTKMMRVVACAAYLLKIAVLFNDCWAFSKAIDSHTNARS